MNIGITSRATLRERRKQVIHPWPLRVMRRLNAVAIVTLVGTGWKIYDASPFLPLTFPQWATIGEWLGPQSRGISLRSGS